jgi:hypothetical protein
MADIRNIATKKSDSEFVATMSPPIELTFSGLAFKGVPVQSVEAASGKRLFAHIITVDSSVQRSDTQKKDLTKHKKLQQYLNHPCVCRHYFNSIRKCGAADCVMCSMP